ncbi:MAG: hypothetical protein H6R26_26, partial [Proteobacteria bacterium]|nr:hypothetical protein [Pseudomonadota bacterium]
MKDHMTYMKVLSPNVLPRLIRLRDAPTYLGMDRNRFNASVRPYLTEIPIGEQGVAFDRLDLDAWADDHKQCNGRPGCKLQPREVKPWAKKLHRASAKGGGVWHVEKTVGGRRLFESTGTGDLVEAERFLVRRLEEIRQA